MLHQNVAAYIISRVVSWGMIAFVSLLASCLRVGHCKMSWKPHAILGSNLVRACSLTLFTSWHHIFQRHSVIQFSEPIYFIFAYCQPPHQLQHFPPPQASSTTSLQSASFAVCITHTCIIGLHNRWCWILHKIVAARQRDCSDFNPEIGQDHFQPVKIWNSQRWLQVKQMCPPPGCCGLCSFMRTGQHFVFKWRARKKSSEIATCKAWLCVQRCLLHPY